ncbi:uncharacterized protein C8R40DRAFT_1119008 [Lentinula edodes]|uniref:uncharacterized protein n=1 Tax=Lentinula edodes TaxID=5353 RepID=UPI001E8E1033|nr:uncharacterized protein C8R40DRAFT_1119008 [Lentinula edodes]KAH7871901.1 hypothetical protein C8R40DRAFT_1119008 [Lentinula edodes]
MARYLSQSRIEGPVWLSPHEKTILQSYISKAEQEIESLDSQIEKLTRDKDIQFAVRASVKNILSPVRQMPNEILSKVFELVCYPDEGEFHAGFGIVRRTTSLSQVCIAWRRAAHDTPSIWSRLSLSIPYHRDLIKGGGKWVVEWLLRSQELPLEFYLDFPENDESYWPEEDVSKQHPEIEPLIKEVHSLLNHVLSRPPFLERIRLLKLTGYPCFFTPLFVLEPFSLCSLEMISIRMTRNFAENHWPVDTFSLAKNLRHVEIIDFYPKSQLETIMLPADQLVKLNIAGIIYSSDFEPLVYTDFLRRCISLVTLEISPPASLEFRSPPAPISLLVLKSLRLTFFSSFYGLQGVSSLLRLLVVPLLEDLTFSLRHVGFQEFVTGITALQKNLPTSNLKSLTLEMGYMANADLTLVLALFPAITSFRLSDIGFDTNHLFQAMTYKKNLNDDFVLLPKISNLELEYREKTSYPSELISMMLSRVDGHQPQDAGFIDVARLRRVCIRQAKFLEKTDEDRARIAEVPVSIVYTESWGS